MATLVDDLVPDQLWAIVQPVLPAPPRPPYGGRRRVIPDRACFAAIVYMARTSTPWRLLPAQELGCGSPATCWRRLTEWANAGVFDQLHLEVLDRLGEQGRLDWSRASVDTMSIRARRGDHVGANPVDRGKPGSKLHLVCEGGGLRRRGIRPRIARRGVESSTRLGRHRWKVERALSWLSCFRRLQIRWDRDSGRWFAFVLVACALICFNRL
jgi:transposase